MDDKILEISETSRRKIRFFSVSCWNEKFWDSFQYFSFYVPDFDCFLRRKLKLKYFIHEWNHWTKTNWLKIELEKINNFFDSVNLMNIYARVSLKSGEKCEWRLVEWEHCFEWNWWERWQNVNECQKYEEACSLEFKEQNCSDMIDRNDDDYHCRIVCFQEFDTYHKKWNDLENWWTWCLKQIVIIQRNNCETKKMRMNNYHLLLKLWMLLNRIMFWFNSPNWIVWK
jgi:hypothetical protein